MRFKFVFLFVFGLFTSHHLIAKELGNVVFTVKINNIKNNVKSSLRLENSERIIDIEFKDKSHVTKEIQLNKPTIFSMIFGNQYLGYVYLKPGADLELFIDTKKMKRWSGYEFTGGSLSDGNNYILQREAMIAETFGAVKYYVNLPPKLFFKVSNKLKRQADQMLQGVNADNQFIDHQKLENEFRYVYSAAMFIKEKEKNRNASIKSEIIKEIDSVSRKITNYSNQDLYKISQSYQLLVYDKIEGELNKIMWNTAGDNKTYIQNIISYLDTLKKGAIKNDALSAVYRYLASNEDKLKGFLPYMVAETTNKKMKSLGENTALATSVVAPGKKSPSFEYENFNGGTTQLEDFKGSYVFIDVWATWCGPCRLQSRYLEKLIPNYEGKNIKFVTISVDELNNYDVWKDMVAKKKMKATHLYAEGFSSDFIKAYGISGIPRFILLGPKGDIISNRAPNPSQPELEKLFETLDL